jgi:hypothetical protein
VRQKRAEALSWVDSEIARRNYKPFLDLKSPIVRRNLKLSALFYSAILGGLWVARTAHDPRELVEAKQDVFERIIDSLPPKERLEFKDRMEKWEEHEEIKLECKSWTHNKCKCTKPDDPFFSRDLFNKAIELNIPEKQFKDGILLGEPENIPSVYEKTDYRPLLKSYRQRKKLMNEAKISQKKSKYN